MVSLNLRTVTLNCWGVPVVARDRKARMQAIGEWLSDSDYDFVFLQELWLQSDINVVLETSSAVYPHQHYFRSGVIGSGMCILSRHTIQSAMYHPYTVNGFAHRLHHGDWFGGKGVGFCRVRVAGLSVNLYVTHLHANYNKSRDDYLCHRIVQSFDCAQFVRLTSAPSGADIVIYAGDFNTNASELPYKLIAYGARLSDAFYLDKRHQRQASDDVISGQEPATCEARDNSYTCRSQLQKPMIGERIDLVFVGAISDRVELIECEYTQPLSRRVPGKKFSYSDHEAVAAKLTLRVQTDDQKRLDDEDTCSGAFSDALSEAISVCESYLRQLCWHRVFYSVASLSLFVLVFLLLLLPTWLGPWLHVLRFGITAVCCYTAFMATFWDRIEFAGVKAGIEEMRIALSSPSPLSLPEDCDHRADSAHDGDDALERQRSDIDL